MLAATADEAFDDPDWAFEIKWGGYRAIADLRGDISLYSRNGLSLSDNYKPVMADLRQQQHDMILDGEIVAFDDQGKPNFQWLQNYGNQLQSAITYQVFDLLWLNGHSTEALNFLQRKELLREALIQTDHIKYCDHVLADGKKFFALVKRQGLEGMMAKKTASSYSAGVRSREWLKIKFTLSDEVLICGFTQPKNSRKHFGSLILGKYNEDNELEFCGHTGTGFNEALLKEIHTLLTPLIIDKPPFDKVPKTNDRPTWVKPELVAEIKYTERTKDGIYRHPVFLRLRDDKDPEELKINISEENKIPVKENARMPAKTSPINSTKMKSDISKKIGPHVVKLTNQDKIYFPDEGITKGDVVAYYQSVANYILPHLKDRPQSLNRFPDGIKGMNFYHKDAAENAPDWIRSYEVHSESNDKLINYIVCNDRATMAYLNNLGCIEMNVWTCRIRNPENPDYLVLDLDPSDKNTFEHVIETCQAAKEVMDLAGIKGYCKTSGSTGLHVYIPMKAKYTFEQVRDFAKLLMQLVQEKLPAITTLERSLDKRDKGKIYLDYLQNRRGQTLASVYSLRPKPGATVSMPLEWSEVKAGLSPKDFNIHNALDRMKEKGDIFKPVLSTGIDMLKAIEKLSK